MSIRKGKVQKRRILTTVILVVVLLLSGLGLAREIRLNHAQRDFTALLEANAGRFNDGRLVLASTSSREAQRIADTLGGSLRITKNGRFALVTLPDGVTLADVAENRALRQYMTDFFLDYNDFSVGTEDTDVAADGDIRANFQTDEPMYPQQTYLDYINIGDSWNVSMGENADEEKVTVAVIDSGIDTDHPEFTDADGNSIISAMSYDATDDKIVNNDGISVIEDEHGHGTAVAGVIASQINGSGIMGIAPDVELLVIKCDVDETGEFKSSADIVFGIYYAIEQDVDVINMSFGTAVPSKDLLYALQLALDGDIIPVASAGNDSTAIPQYPAALETTIGVGALAQDSWELAGYSNYGDNSDIVAPGTTLTTLIGGGYGTENGTSMAAPVVSAAVAIYRSQYPYATFEQVKNDLLAAGKDLGELGEDMYFGFGALDMNAFICEEKGSITYDYCTEDLEATTQVFVKQHTIQTVPEPERENIVFDDWYYDKGYTRVFDYDAWYTTEFVEDVTLYAKWVNEDDEGASVYSYKTLEDGSVEITSYKGKRRYLTVPDEIDGMSVSAIGISAFADNTRLREIILPKGLTTIREYAFDSVSRLRSVTFTGDSLQSIEQRAFQNCSALRKLELPDSVVTIGMEAFVNCSALSSVEITQNSALESIGEKAFSKTALSYLYLPADVTDFDGSVLAYCRNMRSVDIHGDNAAFVVQSGMVLSADGTALVYYPAAQTGTLTVPEGVVSVADYACTASSVTQVEFPESLEQIGEQSFAEARLTALYIPANVQQIEPGAFKNGSRITELTFEENAQLQTIDGNALSGGAFENCARIAALELPGSLVKLGEQSFKGCNGIVELVIPSSVSVMEESAFEGCQGLETVRFEENCALETIHRSCFAYCSKLNTVNFSDGITTIERYAFSNDYLLHTLNFGTGSTLSSIGDYSFYSCTALNQMQLPETVTSIGQYAYAFSGLTSVHVPANLTSIGDGAFGACYLLTEITADAEHTVYAAVDNVLFSEDITTVYCVPSSRIGSYTLPETVQVTAPCSFYYDKLLTEVILPDGLLEIQHDSFYSCSGLQSIVIPGTVTNIGRMGFYNCRSLSNVTFGESSQLQRLGLYTFVSCGMSEITIPASVETMAQYVFSNCSKLKRITFASGSMLSYVAAYLLSGTQVEEVVFEDGSALTQLQAHAFDGTKYLKSVDFGDAALETIDNYAFYNCGNLEQITIPETVTYLGRYTFYGCAGLDRMDIPVTVDYIGISAFNGTNSMKVFFESDTLPANAQEGWDEGIAGYFLAAKEFVVTDDWEYIVTYTDSAALVRYIGSATELTIDTVDGYQVEKIGAGCFADNDTLTAVTIGSNVREIDNHAFQNSAAAVAIPDDSALERIGDHAFSGNVTESLTLPDTVTRIGCGAFEGSSLKILDISENSCLQTIDERAFCGGSLESIYLPPSLETVGAEAFKDAALLTDVTIADGDTALKLSNSAFEGSGITEITVPSRVNYIGEYAFGSCPDLENILVIDDNAAYQDLDGVLLDSSGTTLIQYPGGRNGAYEVPAQISVLSYASFKNAKGLTEVTFAEGSTVKTIGWQTFSGCDGLTKITVPDTVISFDFYAFENCTSLTDVVLGEENRLTGVYGGAFYGCAALTDLNLPDTVIDIGDYAFYGCTGLTAFPLSENAQIKGIGAHAFDGCSGITEVPTFANLSDVGEYAFAYTAISEFTVGAVLNEIANNTFFGCENLMNIYCDEANEEYTAIDGALHEKGATEADGYDALVAWPYGKTLYIGTGKTELTAEDTAFLKDGADIHWEIADTVTTICDKAFQDHKLLRSVVIPENITDMGKNVFWGCYGLKEVYFNAIAMNDVNANDGVFSRTGHDGTKGFVLIVGTNVKRIPSNLFWGSGIREIRFAEGSVCESIGSFAFTSCYKLSSVKIPESVTNLDGGAFYWCENLKSAGPSGGGYDIEFEWKESIPQNAFSRCDALTTVTIPDSVTGIDAGAFSGCTGLERIQIPASVTSIGSKAFYECSGLISVTIPENVTSIGDNTFYGCLALEEINFNATETNTTAGNSGSLNVFGNAGHNGDGITVRFGANVTKVPRGIFYAPSASRAPKIVNVVFEEGSVCKSIGNDAFRGCSYLTHIEIPESVTTIGSQAFYNCTGLTSAGPIGGGYNYEFGWTNDIPSMAFAYCASLTDVTIPKTITSIGYAAFSECTSLADVMIPESVTSIGASAFSNCTSLADVMIPGSVTSIGSSAFSNCTSLSTITIPEKVTSIGSSAFRGCTALEAINFNAVALDSLSSNNYVFADAGTECAGITVTFGANVTTIPAYMFYPCMTTDYTPNIVRVTFDDGSTCEQIGSYAFYNCVNLTNIMIPESVTSMGSSALSGCLNLTSAGPVGGGHSYEFGWTRSIPDYAFYNLKSLTAVELPQTVTAIGNYAFSGTLGITSIVIPESVSEIGEYTFSGCPGLTTAGPVGGGYSYEFGWTNSIPRNAFRGLESLTDAIIPEGITDIGIRAFSNCTELTNVVLPESLLCIGDQAFFYCTALNDIELPDHLISIGASAFSYCNALQSITIPVTVTSIGNQAFYNCTALTRIDFRAAAAADLTTQSNVFFAAGSGTDGITVTIGANVTTIPAYLFYSANRASNIVYISFEEGSVCERIGNYAFYRAEALEEITFTAAAVNDLTSYNNVFYQAGKNSSGVTVCIGRDVTRIPAYLFCPSGIASDSPNIQSVAFEENGVCASIGDYAFKGCSGMISIAIPKHVAAVGQGAFENCTGLTSAGPCGGGYSYEFGWTESIPAYAFYSCKMLTGVVMPESVTEIGSSAFYNCSGLTELTIPEGVTKIGSSAFYNCSGLTELTIPEGVTEIAASAFCNCSGLTGITIPENVTGIGSRAFSGCTSLTEITIPESVVSIQSNAFSNCTSLEKISINAITLEDMASFSNVFYSAGAKGDGVTVTFGKNVTKIPAYLFAGNSSQKVVNVVFEDNSMCASIGNYAFKNCINLTTITIPENVISIGDSAFDNCTALRQIDFRASAMNDLGICNNVFNMAGTEGDGITVTIGANVTKIPASLFNPYESSSTAPKIVDVVFEEGSVCERIGRYAFQHNINLTSVAIPESLLRIDGLAFYNCINLAVVQIDSPAIARLIISSGNGGYVCCYAETVLVSAEIPETGSYITDNFPYQETVTCNGGQYVVYSKHTHDWGEGVVITEPVKCRIDGLAAYTCVTCGLVKQEITYCHNLNHYDGQTPSCTIPGWEAYDICSDCGYTSYTEIPATGHQYEAVVTAPTCAEQGFTAHTCTACGDSYVDTYVEALGHDMGEWFLHLTPTCTADGIERRDCSRCDHYEIRTIEAVGHSFGAWFVNRPASCTECGENRRNCSSCSHYEIEAIPATGHNYESVVTAPTCTEQGYSTHTCSVCGDSYVDTYVDALGHDMGEWLNVTEATCTEDGTERRDCTQCDHHETRTIEATGHSFGAWFVNRSATCTEAGENRRNCANCSHYETEVIPATGHSYEMVVTTPTCTAQGYTTHTCTACADSFVDSYTPALGHDWDDGVVTIDPTEETEGEMTYTCERCGETRTEVIPKLEHVHSYDAVITAPTCTAQGYTTHTCRCGDSHVDTYVDALGHDMGEWETVTEATCTEDGTEGRDCSRCDHYETRSIQAAGHDYESVIIVPTCTEQGCTTHTCTVCGDSYVDTRVDALGHDMGEWKTVTEATCTKEGSERRDCSRCDHRETRTIEATGHSYEAVVTAPTCTEQGYTTHTCACGDSYVDSYTDALGHDYQDRTCIRCGEEDPAASVIASGWSGYTQWVLTGDGAITFSGEGAMKNYTYKSEMPWYAYADQIRTVVIGEGVTSIGAYAFYGMNIESVEIVSTVTTIGDYAFKNCPVLDGVVLPEGLTSLGDSAFYACTGLTSIEIPASLWTIKPYTFKNCTALTEVTFHEGNLQKISDGAFYGTALTELVLPDCLDILDVYSFKNCASLESITIGSGLTEIREAVFYGTVIPDITIPEGITKIGPYAFKNCVELETIDLPETLTSVGEASFYACTGLKAIELPDNVTAIGNYAFRKCAAVTELTLSAELTTVGECAFYGCTGLTELVIPDKVTTIKPYAFKTCTGLTSVVLGESVNTIGEGTFNTCTALKTIVFPASVTSIGDYCFSGSYNLWKLTFEGDAPAIGNGAFKGLKATACYPGENATWTSENMLNYGGTITWKAA